MEDIKERTQEETVKSAEAALPPEAHIEPSENQGVLDFVQEQKTHNRKMQRLMAITAGCMIGILAVVVLAAALILPRTLGILSDVNEITAQVQEMAQQAETVLTDAQEIAAQVKEGDPKKLMDSVNSLAKEGESAMQECVEQIARAVDILDKMDIDSLNTAIDALGKTIAPLAKLFGGR